MPLHADEVEPPRLVTSRQAFLAMIRFLEAFVDRAGPDFATLMTDIEIQADGGPLDPAAWADWMRALAGVVGADEP
jgi:hypothetical protein